MIYLDVNGRCGNQMFQYAFAKKIAKLNNDYSFLLDFFHVDRWRKKANGDDSYSDHLKNFNVSKYEFRIINGNSVLRAGSKAQIRIYRRYPFFRKISKKFKSINILQRYQNKMQKNGIFKEDECFIEPQKCYSKDIFIRGYFENPTFFDDIKKELLDEFVPLQPRVEKNRSLYEIIDNTESVCVSFRVWNEINYDEKFMREHSLCSLEYYTKAINKMHELCPNAHFIIFSNDVGWVKKNFKFNYPVSYEDGDDEIWEKLRMMYSCKHFIMSNSTFCWWAQYLCRNKDKIVISPTKWRDDGKESHLLMDEWIKI